MPLDIEVTENPFLLSLTAFKWPQYMSPFIRTRHVDPVDPVFPHNLLPVTENTHSVPGHRTSVLNPTTFFFFFLIFIYIL